MMPTEILIVVAYFMDLLLGDPRWFPHPVRGIGFCAGKLESPLRRLIQNQRAAGIAFTVLIVGGVYAACFWVLSVVCQGHPGMGAALSVILIYTSLATKDLKVQGMKVHASLKAGKIDEARGNLSFIVGRDTERLGEKEITRATVETVAENIPDGIIAPLFYAFLGGAPLALAYKAASTLDSMVGYKNEQYKEFGWASARLDDVLNYIPARLSAFLLPLASGMAGLDMSGSFKTALRDGRKNPSPNSGIPEAAMAGALGVQLGGVNYYRTVPATKPFLGDEKQALAPEHIPASIRVAYITSFLSLLLGLLITFTLKVGRS